MSILLEILLEKILKSPDIACCFVTSIIIFQLQDVVSPRRVLNAISLPIPIRSMYCMPFLSMQRVGYVTTAVSLTYVDSVFVRELMSTAQLILMCSIESQSSKCSYVYTRCRRWFIIHWCTSKFPVFIAEQLYQNPSRQALSSSLVPINMSEPGR